MPNESVKLIARIKGGLGNQLFCYASARRLALVNDVELVLDDVSGFVRDRTYLRRYALTHFSVPVRVATAAERLEPFERYRRAVAKWRSRQLPFEQRTYLEQELSDFDSRLLDLRIRSNVYIDGLWQSESYFADIAETLRLDLIIEPPHDRNNQDMAARLANCSNAVALHVRWFDPPTKGDSQNNVSIDYYKRALEYISSHVVTPQFFLFSDNATMAAAQLSLPDGRYTVVSHNAGDELAHADLWLMSQCQHFIIANSTFSWWGAWLGEKKDSMVIAPDPDRFNSDSSWRADKLLPNRWRKL